MMRHILTLGCFAALTCSLGWAQITNVTDDTATPIPGAGHDYIKMLSETVNPANGSVSVRIAVPVPKGRGLTIPFAFAYDSNGAHFARSVGVATGGLPSNATFLSKGGWTYSVPQLTEAFGQRVGQGKIPPTCDYYSDYVFQDPSGGRHALGIAVGQYGTPGCSQVPTVSVPSAGDDIFRASTSSLCSQCSGPPPPVSVADPDGTVFQFSSPGQDGGPPNSSVSGSLPTWIEDRNGNKIAVSDSQNGVFSFADTLGRTLLSSSGFGSTGNTVTVSGLPAYSVTWGTVPTNFAVSVEWLSNLGCAMGGDNENLPVLTAITLPNGQSYRFQYDSIYGLLNKIIYPSGGYVRYTWGLNSLSAFAAFTDNETIPNPVGCQCIHDFPAVAHRYVSFDGSTEVEQQDFSYSTTWNGGSWTSKATTVTTHDLLRGGSFQTSYTYIPVTMPLPPNEHSYFATQIPLESTVTNKDWGGSTIRTVTKNWVDQYEMQGQRVVDNGTTTSDQFFSSAPEGRSPISTSAVPARLAITPRRPARQLPTLGTSKLNMPTFRLPGSSRIRRFSTGPSASSLTTAAEAALPRLTTPTTVRGLYQPGLPSAGTPVTTAIRACRAAMPRKRPNGSTQVELRR